jgi:hypothetical protein
MKTEKLFLFGMMLMLVQLVACERTSIESPDTDRSALRTSSDSVPELQTGRYISTANTIGIKQNELILFTLIHGSSPFVMWRAIPAAIVNNNGDSAHLYFPSAGKYRVFAIDSLNYDTTYIDVEVEVKGETEPKIYEQPFYDDDELYITPSSSTDSADVLELRVITKRNYDCLNNNLSLFRQESANRYEISFTKMYTGTFCRPGEKKGQISLWYTVEESHKDIEITFKDKIYKGSMERNGNHYTFNWPYEAGVVFTKKSL